MESGVNPHRYPGFHTAGRRIPIALSTPATPGYTVADALQLESASAPSQIDDLHPDHLGTIRAITDASQTVIWRWDSAPFGDTLPNEDPDGDGQALRFNLRFPGQYFDVETGLHYNYFRDYDPATGRYLESDPIGLDGGINTFAYVGGNPLIASDPFGLTTIIDQQPLQPGGIPGAAGGGMVGGAGIGAAIGNVFNNWWDDDYHNDENWVLDKPIPESCSEIKADLQVLKEALRRRERQLRPGDANNPIERDHRTRIKRIKDKIKTLEEALKFCEPDDCK